MSQTPPEEPRAEVPDLDLGQVAADDALLDALGRGQTPPWDRPDADPITALLTAFRADLDEQAAGLPPAAGAAPAEVAPLPVLTPVTPVAAARHRRWTGRAAAVAVVGGVLVSGTGVAAALTAQPGDLLYGVRRAVVGPVDDSYRKDASALVDQTAKLSRGSDPIPPAVQAQILDRAAELVPGIKDPGRKKAMVNKIASARVALGLPSRPIATDGTPGAMPGPTDLAALGPAPAPAGSPTASPTPGGTASASPSTALVAASPSSSASTSAEGSATPSTSASPTSASPSAPASPSRRRHRPTPSPTPSGSPSASSSPSGSSSPTYSYAPAPKRPKPKPTPSPTFIIG